MAFIRTEEVKDIRNALKKEFPEIKFSVRREHYSAVNVAIMKSPYFADDFRGGVNHYWIKESEHSDKAKETLTKINDIIRKAGNYWDESDAMTDYFHTAFYYNIEIGKFDKPHVSTAK